MEHQQPQANKVRLTLVPYGWTRVISDNFAHQTKVYFVAPSGRVLMSVDEVTDYLEQPDTCKCFLVEGHGKGKPFLDLDVFNVSKNFCFDPTIRSYVVPNAAHYTPTRPHCLQWLHPLSHNIRTRQLNFLQEHLKSHRLDNQFEMYQVLCPAALKLDTKANRIWSFKKWSSQLDWTQLLVTDRGRVFVPDLTTNQLSHLLFEFLHSWVIKPEITVPEPRLKILDHVMDNKTTICKNNNCKDSDSPSPPSTPPTSATASSSLSSSSTSSSYSLSSPSDRPTKKKKNKKRPNSLDYVAQKARERKARQLKLATETAEQRNIRLERQRIAQAKKRMLAKQMALEEKVEDKESIVKKKSIVQKESIVQEESIVKEELIDQEESIVKEFPVPEEKESISINEELQLPKVEILPVSNPKNPDEPISTVEISSNGGDDYGCDVRHLWMLAEVAETSGRMVKRRCSEESDHHDNGTNEGVKRAKCITAS